MRLGDIKVGEEYSVALRVQYRKRFIRARCLSLGEVTPEHLLRRVPGATFSLSDRVRWMDYESSFDEEMVRHVVKVQKSYEPGHTFSVASRDVRWKWSPEDTAQDEEQRRTEQGMEKVQELLERAGLVEHQMGYGDQSDVEGYVVRAADVIIDHSPLIELLSRVVAS